MPTRVLVTRPEPGATATAKQLAESGFDPVLLPLTETRPLGLSVPLDPGDFNAVVATSGAALRYAPASLLREFSHLPLFAVGDRTAGAARQAGFARAESAAGDTPALAAHVSHMLPAGSRIAYLCGRVRTGALADRLRKAGYGVTVVETYDTLPVERTAEDIAAVLDGRPVDAVLLYSANAAVLFARLTAAPATGRLLSDARPICISRRTADALPPAAQRRAVVAATPDEPALLALLRPAR